MNINTIYNEPCLETLRKMPNEFLDCVITSPPYWQLRDYGYEGQWGLEPTFQEYLEHLWEMMDEIYRVLKPSGTVWINLGDTYNSGGNSRSNKDGQKEGIISHEYLKNTGFTNSNIKLNGKPKCLLLIPHRFAIGCIDRGWIMRNDIIWAKRNGMPESVKDRFTKKHEYFFFMTKSTEYYFDLDGIRDKVKAESLKRYEYAYSGNKGGIDRSMIGYTQGDKSHLKGEKPQYSVLDKDFRNLVVEVRNLPPHEELRKYLSNVRNKVGLTIQQIENIFGTQAPHHWFEKNGSYPSAEDWSTLKEILQFDDKYDAQMTEISLKSGLKENNPKGKNSGDVADFWDIPTKPTSDNHYASYNQDLIHKPIIAGCPENGLIYDPFMGTGSTAIAALRRNRNFIGSEMSVEYAKIAEKKIDNLLRQKTLF
jgi:DNA modification methylase